MRRIKMVVVTAIFVLAMVGGWRVGADEVANLELQEDLHDLATQSANTVRYTPPRSDDEYRDAVIRKAKEHGIQLQPNQVTVQRTTSGGTPAVYLGADYEVPVDLAGWSFSMHFTPSSTKNSL